MLNWRGFEQGLLALAGVALLLCGAESARAQAQAYPNRVVRLIVPFAPGGSAEAQARVLAQKLAEIWGQPVIVEGKPGAGTTVGAAFVAKSPPDGYTLFMAYMLSHSVTANLYRNLPYDPIKSFAPISNVVTQPFIVAVHPGLAANTLKDLIDLARARPGVLTYSTSGTGAGPHLAAEIFRSQAGIQVVHVPFKGSSPALVALIGAQVDFSFQDATALTNIQAGKLRALAVSTAKRWSQLPSVPTIAESGFPGYDVTSAGMLLAPAGTPREIILQVNAAVQKAIAAPDLRERLAAQGFDVEGSTPEELGSRMAAEIGRYGKVIRELGLSAE